MSRPDITGPQMLDLSKALEKQWVSMYQKLLNLGQGSNLKMVSPMASVVTKYEPWLLVPKHEKFQFYRVQLRKSHDYTAHNGYRMIMEVDVPWPGWNSWFPIFTAPYNLEFYKYHYSDKLGTLSYDHKYQIHVITEHWGEHKHMLRNDGLDTFGFAYSVVDIYGGWVQLYYETRTYHKPGQIPTYKVIGRILELSGFIVVEEGPC